MFVAATHLIPTIPVRAEVYWVYFGSAVFWEMANLGDLLGQSGDKEGRKKTNWFCDEMYYDHIAAIVKTSGLQIYDKCSKNSKKKEKNNDIWINCLFMPMKQRGVANFSKGGNFYYLKICYFP